MGLEPGDAPAAFAAELRDALGGRAWLLRDARAGGYRASSPRLAALAAWLEGERSDAHGHEALFLQAGPGSGALFAAVLHRSVRGQAQGGVRVGHYPGLEALLRDGLRLSQAMTRKNALAHLWWGGGKGIVAGPGPERLRDPDFRRLLFQEYGAFVSSLRGCYVTAEDAGTGPADMAEVFRTTRFATCIPAERGGSGDPSPATAAGVACAMQAALAFVGLRGLRGRRVAVQGLGRVGGALVEILLERGVASLVASDTDPERCRALRRRFDTPRLELREAAPGDLSILAEPCDVLAPCALGGVLGTKTIPDLQAKVVCGAANNPLADEAGDAAALVERGVVCVPDFLANRMGIVWCANEQYGQLDGDPAVGRHLDEDWSGSIPRTVRRVLEESMVHGTTPHAEACRMADALAGEPHPVFGHRAWRIAESLAANGWASGG
jgi:leucine dehydrogenase